VTKRGRTRKTTRAATTRGTTFPAAVPPTAKQSELPDTRAVPPPAERRDWAELVDRIVVVAAALFVLVCLKPGLILANTTPTGGDLGGHVLGPALMRGHLFGHGLLASWSNAWFGGFPSYRFYPPLPALGVVTLDTILPYGVALKVMVAVGLVAMPVVAWYFGRAARLPVPVPGLMALASLLVLFDSSNLKYGGSIASAVIGEYANALGITLGLLCLARFTSDLGRDRRFGVLAGLIGAAAALCHPIAAAFVVIGLLSLAGSQLLFERERWRNVLAHLGTTLGLTVVISAFWYLPFFAWRAYTNDLSNPPIHGLGVLFPLPWPISLLLVALAIVGVLDAVRYGRAPVVGVAATGVLFALWTFVAPKGMLWNARLAPLWFLTMALVAAAGVGASIAWAQDRLAAPRRDGPAPWLVVAAPIALAVIVMASLAWDMGVLPGTTHTTTLVDGREVTTDARWIIGPHHTPSPVPSIVRTAFNGYERDVHYRQYRSLISTMERLSRRYGCGRVMPEFDPKGTYGSVYGEALLPYWTDGCITTVTGRENDSSPTSAFALVAESALSKTFSGYEVGLPYEPLDLTRGYQYLRELGARYYLAHSREAIAAASQVHQLERVATVGSSVVFLVEKPRIVLPLSVEPIVITGVGGDNNTWEKLGLTWFKNADEAFPRVAASGPSSWQHVAPDESVSQLHRVPETNVRNTHVGDDSISFDVDRTGLPILVRVSAFPWWHAVGAEGPYRVTPNWMVVVPTSKHVTIIQRTQPIEWFGTILSIAGLLFVGAAAAWKVRQRMARSPRPQS
jgi:hypothetical protein